MRLYNARLNDQGFTLLELLIVVVFAGVLASIAAPSFLAMNRGSQLNSDLASAEGALLEAQRGAMRTGQNCALNLTSPSTISSSSGSCLSGGTRTLSNVSMEVSTDNTTLVAITPTSTSGLTFRFDGSLAEYTNTTLAASTNTTIVLQHNSNTGTKKCIVISSPLGLIATGKYTGTSSTNISSNCTP